VADAMRIEEAVSLFCASHGSAATVRSYAAALTCFTNFCAKVRVTSLREVSPALLTAYPASLVGPGSDRGARRQWGQDRRDRACYPGGLRRGVPRPQRQGRDAGGADRPTGLLGAQLVPAAPSATVGCTTQLCVCFCAAGDGPQRARPWR
ncbi:MAG TPA: hypothetical protein VNH82_02865, partial [Candidatus Dormibacteraeota bacterium]|nr:hypothetical protein [Candidatus Dormibacteraeota bacterium]